jgi:demethylmenaquinone methyltransferase/2-methoxy-6-polyprenyl-1,4-benzoquinol methylase
MFADMNTSRTDLVRRFFSGTGASYDFMVVFGTFGCDRYWKRRILAALPSDPKRVLDLACGTGIVTLGIAKRYPDCRVTGVDITKEYLDIAREKAEREKISNVDWIHQKAEALSLDGPFDAVTASYLPKYADLPVLAKTVHRMLKNGGRCILHDFSYPPNPVLASIWEFYFKVQQSIGWRFYPEWKTVYEELPELIRTSPWVADLKAALDENGFSGITVERLTFGSATLVTAEK